MNLLFVLLACGSSVPKPLPTCDATPSEVVVAACFTPPPSADTGAYYLGIDGTWSGTVVEVTQGAGFPAACERDFGGDPGADAWWARLDTAEGEVWVGLDVPGSVPPVVGTEATVRAFHDPGEWDPTDVAVEVRDAAGARLGFAGEAGTPEEILAPEGFVLTTGVEVCLEEDGCGDSAGHDLDVATDAGSVTVPRGGTATVDGVTVSAAALIHQVEAQGGCPDWFVATARVGIGAAP